MRKRLSRRAQLMVMVLATAALVLGGTETTLAYSYGSNLLSTTDITTGSGKDLYYDQTVALSSADIIRANKGDLTYVASIHEGANGSRTVTTNLQVQCKNAAGVVLDEYKAGTTKYWVAHASYDYNSGSRTLPAGTTQIRYYASVHIGTSGDLELENMSLMLYDGFKPAYSTASLASINGYAIPAGGSVAGTYPAGTALRYAVKFDEPVQVTSTGTFSASLSGTSSPATYKEQSADRMTLYYDYVIPTSGVVSDNATVKMSSIAGLVVRDDAGNSTTVDKSLADGYGLYMDNKRPTISSFTTTASANGCYRAGDQISFNVYFHEAITVSGSPAISLSNGKQAVYTAGSGSDTNLARFVYTVGSFDSNTDALAITSVNFSGIVDKVKQTASYNPDAYDSFLSSYRLQIDTVAPKVGMSDPGVTWHDSDYSVVLAPTDASGSLVGSGVDELYVVWTKDAGSVAPAFPATPNVGSVNTVAAPPESGTYYLWVRAVDRAGNAGAVRSPYAYKFDLLPPAVVITPTTVSGYPSLVSVAVAVTDNASGVASQTYAWKDADAVTVASGDLTAGIGYPTADGEYTLEVTARDALGNQTITETAPLCIDKTPPTVDFLPPRGDEYKQSYLSSVTLTDTKSGVANYAYQWASTPQTPSEGWIPTTLTEFSTPDNVSGGYYLHIKATDAAGNTGYAASESYNLDNTAPTITVSPNGNAGLVGRSEYEIGVIVQDAVTPNTDLTVQYAFGTAVSPDSLEWQPLSGSTVTLSELRATTYLYIRATDLLGNMAEFKSAPFIADTTAPSGSITNGSGRYLNAGPILLEFAAADDYSGEADLQMRLTIDGILGEWSSLIGEKSVDFPLTEGVHTISVCYRDASGNTSDTYSTSFTYDVTPPTIDISYSAESATNGSVTATASTAAPDWIDGASSFVFAENGRFTFSAIDPAGNSARATAQVTWIDKTAPTVAFSSASFDNRSHQGVAVAITAQDNANGVAALEYRFSRDGENGGEWLTCANGATVTLDGVTGKYYLQARAVDGVGNQGTRDSTALYLDNTAPLASITYEPNSRTAANVQATVSFNEPTTIQNNSGSNSHVFTENGSFRFEFVDEAGNAASAEATVDWIDRTRPSATVSVKDLTGQSVDVEQWVNHDLLVTVAPAEHAVLAKVSWNGQEITAGSDVSLFDAATNTYQVAGYGVLSFTLRDGDTGLESQLTLTMLTDKTPPQQTSERRTPTGWTNGDVTVTITAADALSAVTYLNGDAHVFTENGSHTFYFADALGNQGEYTVTVTNIDKNAPEPSVTYTVNGAAYDGGPTNQDVVATISLESLSPASVLNNGGSLAYTFTANGEFTFEFANAAGNSGQYTVRVGAIDKTPPTFDFESGAFDGKNHQSISVTVNAADNANGIAALEYRFVKEGSAGGAWQDCENGEQVTLSGVDGQYYLEVRAVDGTGNHGSRQSNLLYLDNTAPVASLAYEPGSRTARNVQATLSSSEPFTVRNNGGSNSYVFAENGTFTFEFEDEAGNVGSIVATVDWIDRTLPSATVSVTDLDGQSVASEQWVNYDLLVTIAPPAQSEIGNLTWNGSAIAEATGAELYDAAANTYLVTEYGVFSFTVRDTVTGMENEGDFTVRLDKAAPTFASERRTPSGWTSGDVVVSMTAEDDLSAVTYLNGNAHTFTDNGSHTFYFTDAAGNQGEYTVTVNTIDRDAPVPSVHYTVDGVAYDSGPTNRDVVATVYFAGLSPVAVLNNGGGRSYTFTANGEFNFEFVNAAGIGGSCSASVDQIDKTPPTVSFTSQQFDGKSHQAAEVTIQATDAINGVAALEYRFALVDGTPGDWQDCSDGAKLSLDQADGSYRLQVRATDGVGNSGVSESEILYLDNTAPVASLRYQPDTRTAQNVQAAISFNEPATILNNGGSNSYVFADNGSFSFEFVDEAGNQGSRLAEVTWIDRSVPEATVSLRDLQNRSVAVGTWVNHDLLVSIAPRAHAEIVDLTWNGTAIADAAGVSLHDAASHTYLVTTYGAFSYTVRDVDTRLESKSSLRVCIDKQAPLLTSDRRTPESWTNGDVTVTITVEDALTAVSYQNGRSHTFAENGSHTFYFVDAVGNQGEYTVTVNNIDKTPPVPMVTYTVNGAVHGGEYTNQDVTATIAFDSQSPVTVTNNGGSESYTFAANGAFTFEFVDAAGNSDSFTARVDCIDKTPPTAYVTYSTERWTNQDIVATLHVSDGLSGAANDGTPYTFQANGVYEFTAYDQAGNARAVKATVARIDKTPPKLSYTLSPANRTPYSVFATVTADESVTWLNNGGRPSLQFSSNGSFTFKAQDRAGNTAEIAVVVENMSKESTPVVLAYSRTDPTNGNVYVTIAPQDAQNDTIFVLNNGGSSTYAFAENGEFIFTYRNPAGIEGTATASVSNIDKLAPTITVTYSTTELTNGSVTATLTADEPVVWPFGVKDGALLFTDSDKLLIPVADLVGNVTKVLLEVTWIDRTPPTISLAEEYQAIAIGSRFDALAGVTAYDEHLAPNGLTYQGTVNTKQPGDYTITYIATDVAGNSATVQKHVTVYDPRQFNVVINGRMPVNSEVEISGATMQLETINQEGELTLLFLPGKKGCGDFKLQGNEIGQQHTFSSGGYYTLYIQDDERHTQLVYLFVKP